MGQNVSSVSELISAVRDKNTEKVSDLVEKLNVWDVCEMNGRNGGTALHFACQNFNHEAVDILLAKSGIDINVKEVDGFTPLHTACAYNNHHAVKKLLARTDVEVNVRTSRGSTPLHTACLYNNHHAVKKLLARTDVEVNVRTSRGNTPIMASAMWCREETLKLMLDETRVTLETENDRSLEELVGSRGSKESQKKKCLMMIEERTKRESRQAEQKPSQGGNIVGWAEKKEEERAIETHVENKEEEKAGSSASPNVDNDLSLCWSCFKSRRDVELYKCGVCKRATAYCSRECLEKDVPVHNNWCVVKQENTKN